MRTFGSNFGLTPALVLTALLGTALGCGGKQVPTDELSRERPATPAPSFSLDGIPNLLKFEQPFRREFDLLAGARVDRGSPVLTVAGLPEGATFDGRFLSWAPSCDLPDEFFGGPRQHTTHQRVGEQDIIVKLQSDDGSEHFIERAVALVVWEYQEFPPDRLCEGAL